MVDIHSHMLPGIDDGPDDINESVEMARMALHEGITAVVCTPHAIRDFDQLLALAEERLQALKGELARRQVPLALYQGFEVYASESLLDYQDIKRLTLPGGKRMLLEFDFGSMPACADEVLYLLRISNITPVLAHLERFDYMNRDIGRMKALKQQGAMIQVNTGSITGMHGRAAQKCAKKMIKAGLVDYIATDAHSTRRRGPYVAAAAGLISKWASGECFDGLMSNAEDIVNI